MRRNLWRKVLRCEILTRVGLPPDAKYVVVPAHDGGWTTNVAKLATRPPGYRGETPTRPKEHHLSERYYSEVTFAILDNS